MTKAKCEPPELYAGQGRGNPEFPTNNNMKGARITTLHELRQAAIDKRSVTVNHHHYQHRTPAAWLINIIGMQLCHYLDCGIYLYEPNPKLPKFSDRYKQGETKQETKLLTNK